MPADYPNRYPSYASEQPSAATFVASRRPGDVKDRHWLHLLLFVVTFASTVHSGGYLVGRFLAYENLGGWWFVPDGIRFAFSLLLFLAVHEFGHYIAARKRGVAVSLPYFIPLPLIGIGTLGAVIRIREPIPSMRALFDIGAAGPVAGFIVAFSVLIFAFATLPGPEMVHDLPGHDALKQHVEQHGTFPESMPAEGGEMSLVVGQTLLYWFLSQFFENVPPMYEMYHYPFLFAGWLGLFFTALNLLPVGQLDGGHILYALVGRKWHGILARSFVTILLISGAIGFAAEMGPSLGALHPFLAEISWFILAGIVYFYLSKVFDGHYGRIVPVLGLVMFTALASASFWPALQGLGYSGWFIWCLLIVFLIRIDHPSVLYEEPLTPGRRLVAISSILIFILCFSFRPIYIV